MMMVGAFYASGALLGYIPDLKEPISHDKYDYLETCTYHPYHQIMFGRQFPPRYYRYRSTRAPT